MPAPSTGDPENKATNCKRIVPYFLGGLFRLFRYMLYHCCFKACKNHFLKRPTEDCLSKEDRNFVAARFELRQKLKHHFKSHFEKWTNENFPLFPWKAMLHILLIILVTAQVSLFLIVFRSI